MANNVNVILPLQSYSACWLFILEHLLLQLQNDYHTSRYHVLYPTLPKVERAQKSVVQSPVPLLFSRKKNFPCKYPTNIFLSHWSDQGHILLDQSLAKKNEIIVVGNGNSRMSVPVKDPGS